MVYFFLKFVVKFLVKMQFMSVVWFMMIFGLLLSSMSLSAFIFYFELIALSVVFLVTVHSDLRVSSSLIYLFTMKVVSFLLVLWSMVLKSELMLVVAFFVKLSFFPFVWWFPYMSDQMKFFCFFLVGVLNKMFPLILMGIKGFFSEEILLLMVLVSLMISLMNLCYKQKNMKAFLAWSSKMNFSLIMMMMVVNWLSGLVYMVWYIVLIVFFLFFLDWQSGYWDQYCVVSCVKVIGLLMGLCVFSGLPPFLGFFCKYLFFYSVSDIAEGGISLYMMFLVLMMITFQSFVYMKVMFKVKVSKWVYFSGLNVFGMYMFLSVVFFMVGVLIV